MNIVKGVYTLGYIEILLVRCGLDKDVPSERPIQSKPSNDSKIIKLARVGGLHSRYQWKEAA